MTQGMTTEEQIREQIRRFGIGDTEENKCGLTTYEVGVEGNDVVLCVGGDGAEDRYILGAASLERLVKITDLASDYDDRVDQFDATCVCAPLGWYDQTDYSLSNDVWSEFCGAQGTDEFMACSPDKSPREAVSEYLDQVTTDPNSDWRLTYDQRRDVENRMVEAIERDRARLRGDDQ